MALFAGVLAPVGPALAANETINQTATQSTGTGVATTGYDKDQVLEVNGQPFFYNGVQYRIDKNATMFGHTDADIQRLMGQAKSLGYSTVSAQITWADIQPDTAVSAAEATYIAGGANATTNFNGSLQTGYDPTNADNQSLALLKFTIPSDYTLPVDGAKIRIKTSTALAVSHGLKAYSIDSNWQGSTITWANSGYSTDGTTVTHNGQPLEQVGALPTWDQVKSAYTYDIDITDSIKKARDAGQSTVSFLLQDTTASSTPTKIVAPSSDATGSQLWLSSKDKYDYTHLDHVVDYARQAGLKFEIIWFGSDTTGITTDDRVPDYALADYQKSLKPNGQPFFAKNTDPRYGPYRYLLDKADPNLEQQESHVIGQMFNHLASTDPDYTVVGIQTTNEPQIVQLNGSWQKDSSGANITHSYSDASVARWNQQKAAAIADGTYVNDTQFGDQFRSDLMWEYNNALAKAVKDSGHPVWTRVNHHGGTDSKGLLSVNEKHRANGGTYLDFVGIDPYRNATADVYRIGHAPYYDQSRTSVAMPNFAQGENLPMSMENGGDYPNIGQLIVATLAGGAYNTTYDLCGADGHSILNDSASGTLDGACTTTGTKTNAGANQSYATYQYADKISQLTSINKTLLEVGYDLATKQADGAGGTKALFFNPTADSDNNPISAGTKITKTLDSVNVTYTVDASQGSGIAIEHAANEIALVNLGSQATTYTLAGLADKLSSAQSGSYDRFQTAATENSWEANADQTGVSTSASGADLLVTVPAYSTVRVLTTTHIAAPTSYLYEAEGLVYNGVETGPFGLSTTDDKIYRDGAHGGYWLKISSVNVGNEYSFTVPVPAGVTSAHIVTAYRGATSGRGTVQLLVNGTPYGTPINQIRSSTGFFEEAPDQSVTLNPGQKNTFTYKATAGSNTTLSFDYIKIVPDVAPLQASAALNPAQPDGSNGWYVNPVAATISASGGYGTIAPQYKLDDGTWTDYSGPVTISSDGTHTLSYHASDDYSTTADSNVSLKIDRTAPTVSSTFDDPSRSLTISTDDAASGVAGIQYKIDGGDWQNYTTAIPFDNKSHTVVVHATDEAGNTSADKTVTVLPPAWNKATAYQAGDTVSYNGSVFTALWYSKGEQPGSNVNGAWQQIVTADDGKPVWTASRVFRAGDYAEYNGKLYLAAWYTRNEKPGSVTGPWQEIASAPDGTAIWTPSRIFNSGDTVTYNGQKYVARWYTRNQAPGTPNGPWAASN